MASSSHLSPSQQCHPPYLSPPFQGQAKLFLLPFSVKGGLIIMMMLAIYLLHPGSCSTLHPHPCQMPASPRLFPCLLLLALVTGWVFSQLWATLSLQQRQDGRVGNHGQFRTLQGLYCLLLTSDGTNEPEGLHPRVVIFPQGSFMWKQRCLVLQ